MKNIEEYNEYVTKIFKELENWDWYYHMSDDHRVWLRGEAAAEKLKLRRAECPLVDKIAQAWYNYMFGGQTFGKPEAPKPILEDYLKQ